MTLCFLTCMMESVDFHYSHYFSYGFYFGPYSHKVSADSINLLIHNVSAMCNFP